MSAWRIQRRNPDSAMPRSWAIALIGFSRRRASSTARRRNSGLFGAGIRTPLGRPSSPHQGVRDSGVTSCAGLVVVCWVEGELAEEFAGGGGDDADVEV